MRWASERYVKLYTRDTAEWLSLPWQARALFYELMRKADRDGTIPCGKLSPAKAIAVLIRGDAASLEQPVADLLGDGCLVLQGEVLILRNYVAAQEAAQTGAARKRNERESFDMSRAVTPCPEVATYQNRTEEIRTEAKLAPLAIHLQGQCPKLASAVAAASRAGVGVNVGRRATLWGEAESLLAQTTEEAAISAWVAAGSKRREGPADVPLGYLVPVLKDLVAPRKPSRGVQALPPNYKAEF